MKESMGLAGKKIVLINKKYLAAMSFLMALVSCQYLFAASIEQEHSLNLASIGIANPGKPLEARKINELKFFDGRLYVGQGDYAVNTGPTDIIYYDPTQDAFVKEFTVDDEAIIKYCVVNDQLMVPGTDATESWEWGNFYVRKKDGWQKHRTIPNAGHVFDVVAYKGDLFISGMLMIKRPVDYVAPGGVYVSKDGGETCGLSWMSPCDAMAWNKCGSMVIYKDKLYVFSYFYTGYEDLNKFPEEYRAFQTTQFAGLYLFYKWDFCGPADAAVYDSEIGWSMKDLISDRDVCKIDGFAFQDKLVMAAVRGKYITASPYAQNAVHALYVYDGQKTTKADIDYGVLLDKLVKSDQLYLLVYRNGQYEILETNDLSQWKVYTLPKIMSRPMSIEHDGQAFYIGTADGNVFKSYGPAANIDHDSYIRKFYISANLPHEARSCWAAIDQWDNVNETARLSCEIAQDKDIVITSDNVKAFTVEIPFSKVSTEVKSAKTISIKIDDQKTFTFDIYDFKTWKCTRDHDDKWSIEKSSEPIDQTRYSKQKIIGHTARKLLRNDPSSQLQLWKAQILRWAAKTDIALINHDSIRRDMAQGQITVADVYELNHGNDIMSFSATGAELLKMMECNLQLGEKDRCQIAGFDLTWDTEKKRVTTSSLDMEKTYTIAISSYMDSQSQKYFGRQLNCQSFNTQIRKAMVRWLMEFNAVPEMKQKIRLAN